MYCPTDHRPCRHLPPAPLSGLGRPLQLVVLQTPLILHLYLQPLLHLPKPLPLLLYGIQVFVYI